MLTRILKRKFLEPIKGFFKQGLSAKKLSLGLAFGVTLGTFPILGATTILCTLAAIILKLNMPVIQFANYLVYPLQVALLVPFYYLGDFIFNAHQGLDFSIIKDMLTGSTNEETIAMLLESTLYAVGAWLLISPLTLALLYTGLNPILASLSSAPSRLKVFRR